MQLSDLVSQLGGELQGQDRYITQVASLDDATDTELSFLTNPKYVAQLAHTQAAAVIVKQPPATKNAGTNTTFWCHPSPYLTYAKAVALLNPTTKPKAHIHPTAIIADSAHLAHDVCIEAHVVIGANSRIESGAWIKANSVIEHDCVIGANTIIENLVTIKHRCQIGANCHLENGVVIGGDGFGWAPTEDKHWHKIPQIGRVIIHNNVSIGSNTTIDRGALKDTILGEGVKLDNLIQIGHNVHIGEHTAIAAHTAVAGSTTIGKHCMIAGAVAIAGHLHIADGTFIGGMSMVSGSIAEGSSYSGGMPLQPTADWRKNAVRIRQLDKMFRRLSAVEKAFFNTTN